MNTLAHRRLLLSPGCRLLRTRGCLTVAARDEEISLTTADPDAFERALLALDGQAAACANEQAGVPAAVLEPVLATLLEADLLLDLDRASEAPDPEAMAGALRASARFWARPIFEQPFWEDLLAGRLSRAQVLGWGTEFYHFVDAANRYMPLGVAHCRQAHALHGALSRQYVEEMRHAAIFLDGLVECGLERAALTAAPPLPQTLALINQLAELAYEGELAYTASFAIMQPGLTPPSETDLDRFYERLTEQYPYAASLFRAFRRHAALDHDLRHEDTLFYRLCRDSGGLEPRQCRRAEAVMQTVAESFILFFEGIRDAYPGDAFAPRRPLHLEGLA
ncbi:iron-containing redox enzyme family protein [Massilia horti]|uniref:Uncharacterized protein n=1 Tax=Massilia horti TaxID=2562153 RepID=A0A4Y9T5E1_9BURK|nr:iron-containing redox enzyme family protein [Massilia horti]TFW33643.1 hypothetical protein E4O92_06525 [Massilia horti]